MITSINDPILCKQNANTCIYPEQDKLLLLNNNNNNRRSSITTTTTTAATAAVTTTTTSNIPGINNNKKKEKKLLISKDMIELTTSNTSTENTEEAVLPPTYAKLPTTKLEEEPNPFEQSFEGATKAAEIMPLPPERIIPDPMLDTTSKKMDCFNPICMNFLLFCVS